MTVTTPTENQKKAINAYAALMEELRERLYVIRTCLSGESHLSYTMAFEFACLQVRIICEIIALGCLILHGDIKQTRTQKFSKAYSADKIMLALEKLHGDFYPKPFNYEEDEHGRRFRNADYDISKEDLLNCTGRAPNFFIGAILGLCCQRRKFPQYSHRWTASRARITAFSGFWGSI